MLRRRLAPPLALLAALLAAAPASAAVHSRLLSEKRHAGDVVVRQERVTVGGATSNVTTVTMPRPGRGRALEPVLPEHVVSHGTMTTSAASRALSRLGTAVTINADLFEYASGQPSGLLVMDGEIYNQPQGGRPALAIDYRGEITLTRPSARGEIILRNGRKVPFEINVKRSDGVVVYDRGWGMSPPAGSRHSVHGHIRDGAVFQRGNTWRAVADMRAALSRGGALGVPSEESPRLLFSAYGRAAKDLRAARKGARFDMRYRISPLSADARFAVGGGPILIRDGKVVYRRSANREFSDGQLVPPDARTAVAQLRDGRILFYAVDRGAGSPGFTVPQMTKDLARRGARTAMAFDSGGSTAVSVNGRLLNKPADGVERPVGNLLSYVVMKRKYRTPIRHVRIGAVADGQVAPPLSFTLKRRAPVEVQLVQPGGRVRYGDLGSVRRGTHRIPMPKRPRPGRWQVDVAVPAYGDRVVKEFVVRRTPKAAAVAQPPSASPERAPVATPARATAAAREAGSSPWPWIAGGVAVVVAAGGAGLLAARRRRG